jgi:hypothetical protein
MALPTRSNNELANIVRLNLKNPLRAKFSCLPQYSASFACQISTKFSYAPTVFFELAQRKIIENANKEWYQRAIT